MCNIWQLPPGREMSPGDYVRLPDTLNDVNITGGEPFLREDIVEIIGTIYERCRAPRIVISSNGFQHRRILHAAPSLMKIGKKVGIAISLDGIGEMHDSIRGINGGFDKVIETLKQLGKLGYRNVRVAFTAQRDNVDHLGAVYDLSRQFGFQFTTSVAQNSEFYFSTDENQKVEPGKLSEELRYVMRKELLSLNPKRWLRSYFYLGVLQHNDRGRRLIGCRAGRDSFFIDPEGDIYPCLTLERKMGNILEQPFEEIWNGEPSATARKAVDTCSMPCWMICTARTSMKRRPDRPAGWILKNWGRIMTGRGISD
jgi:radical SAM protein with 4Fe4S-binding SPASM domain